MDDVSSATSASDASQNGTTAAASGRAVLTRLVSSFKEANCYSLPPPVYPPLRMPSASMPGLPRWQSVLLQRKRKAVTCAFAGSYVTA